MNIIQAINKSFEDKSSFISTKNKEGETFRIASSGQELIIDKDGQQWRFPFDLYFKCFYKNER